MAAGLDRIVHTLEYDSGWRIFERLRFPRRGAAGYHRENARFGFGSLSGHGRIRWVMKAVWISALRRRQSLHGERATANENRRGGFSTDFFNLAYCRFFYNIEFRRSFTAG